jgi:hypothetical protein
MVVTTDERMVRAAGDRPDHRGEGSTVSTPSYDMLRAIEIERLRRLQEARRARRVAR